MIIFLCSIRATIEKVMFLYNIIYHNNYFITIIVRMKAIFGSSPFKQKFSLAQRIKMSCKIQILSDQFFIPIVVERSSGLLWGKEKRFQYYAASPFKKVKQLVAQVKRQLEIGGQESIVLTIKNKVLNQEETMKELYDQYKDEDGFLYFSVTSMETF